MNRRPSFEPSGKQPRPGSPDREVEAGGRRADRGEGALTVEERKD